MTLLKIYGHPRSGTNLVMAFVAENFYPGRDLTGPEGVMGHWADSVPQEPSPWPYGALFGGHHFRGFFGSQLATERAIYIYRDGRDVAVSLWRTKAFLHPNWRILSFSEFLQMDLDWQHSPGHGGSYDGGIIKHWHEHLESWVGSGASMVRFEDLVLSPANVRYAMALRFGFCPAPELARITGPVGPFPHEGRVGTWRVFFNDDDLEYFYGIVPPDFWGLWKDV